MNRLFPIKKSGRYFILTELRKAYVYIISKYLLKGKKYKLVDYGCGEMPYKSLFGSNIEYIGYDLNINSLADKVLDVNNITYEENYSVDIVLSSQVLEHVEKTNNYLNEIHRILKEDGLLFLSTHGTWMYHPSPNDYWRWTNEGLIKQLLDYGFELIELISIGDLTTAGLQLFQDGIRNRIPRPFRGHLFFLIQFLQYRLFKDQNSKDAVVILGVFRKR